MTDDDLRLKVAQRFCRHGCVNTEDGACKSQCQADAVQLGALMHYAGEAIDLVRDHDAEQLGGIL